MRNYIDIVRTTRARRVQLGLLAPGMSRNECERFGVVLEVARILKQKGEPAAIFTKPAGNGCPRLIGNVITEICTSDVVAFTDNGELYDMLGAGKVFDPDTGLTDLLSDSAPMWNKVTGPELAELRSRCRDPLVDFSDIPFNNDGTTPILPLTNYPGDALGWVIGQAILEDYRQVYRVDEIAHDSGLGVWFLRCAWRMAHGESSDSAIKVCRNEWRKILGLSQLP